MAGKLFEIDALKADISLPPNALAKVSILTADQFRLAFGHISTKIYTEHFTFLLAKKESFSSAIGIVIAKKKVKSAVKRNLCRRLIKEAFRLNKCFFKETMVIAIATGQASQAKKKQLWASINLFLEKCATH